MKNTQNVLKSQKTKKCAGQLRPAKQVKRKQHTKANGSMNAVFKLKAKLIVVITAAFLMLLPGNGFSPSA